MDEETKQWYEAQFDLFATKGWKDFLSQVQDNLDSYKLSINRCKDLKDFGVNVGNQEALEWILSWPSLCEQTYERLNEKTF